MRGGVHSSSRLALVLALFGLVLFEFAALLFGAIFQIWLGAGTGSMRGCESESGRTVEEDEMAKWRRWQLGMRRHSYKALSLPLHS